MTRSIYTRRTHLEQEPNSRHHHTSDLGMCGYYIGIVCNERALQNDAEMMQPSLHVAIRPQRLDGWMSALQKRSHNAAALLVTQ